VIVPDAQLSLAIGRRGQNVRLASQLTGWDIDILTETEEAERRQREFRSLTEYFVNALNVEEVIAQLLVTEGFSSVDEVLYVDREELASIQGFDETVADALRERAEQYLTEREASLREEAASLGLSEDLLGFEELSLESIVGLGRQGIKSLDDLADLAADELIELLPEAPLTEAEAGRLIMAARAHWFGDEQPDAAADAEAGADAEPDAGADLEAGADDEPDVATAPEAADGGPDAEEAPSEDPR
jgi:N utilization substance protein A